MKAETRREIVAVLHEQKRPDLAEHIATAAKQDAARFSDGIAASAQYLTKTINDGHEQGSWNALSAMLTNLKTVIAMLDGGTREPPEIAALHKVHRLLNKRR